MKYLLSLSLIALICGCYQYRTPLDCEAEHSVQLCADSNDRMVIHDHKIKNDFLKKASKLVEDKKTVDMKVLVKESKDNKDKKVTIDLPVILKEEMSTEDLYKKYLKSTLVIGTPYICKKCKNLHTGFASGFILSKSGVAVTSYHMMKNRKDIKSQTMVVMNAEGKCWPVKSVLSGSEVDDYVFLQLEGDESDFHPIPIQTKITTGEKVRTLTNPIGHFFTLSEGIVTRKYKSQKGNLWFNIDADYCKGSSGGPIFDKLGNVLGIVSSTNSIYYTENKEKQKDLQMVFKNVTSSNNFKNCLKDFTVKP